MSDPNYPAQPPYPDQPETPPGGQFPYGAYHPGYYGPPYGTPLRHSGLGITSFIISIVVGVMELILVIAAAVMVAQGGGEMDEQSPTAIVLGCMLLVGLGAAVVGAILGLISVSQRDRKRLFGILGLCFNLGILLLLGLLMLIGMMQR